MKFEAEGREFSKHFLTVGQNKFGNKIPVPHLSSFTIFSECFWVLYVSTSCLPRMFSSIDSSKRESVCGKAWWYGRDVPKVKILFHSRRPTTFGKDNRWSLQIFCCNYVPIVLFAADVLAPSIYPSKT